MNKMIDKLRTFLETHAFGVCSAIGEKLGIASLKLECGLFMFRLLL
jgi:hypothetical protein